MADWASPPEEVVARAGLDFRDPALLRTALTHRSYLNEHPELDWADNERLEFLGDAVLGFVLADYLYRRFPDATEGELTTLRAVVVRRDTLASLARSLGLADAMYMGFGESETGGRERPATQCAVFEALVGALFLDTDLDRVREWVVPLVQGLIGDAQVEAAEKDPKSRLQELAQRELGLTPRYVTTKAEGPDHAKTFTVEAWLGEERAGTGEGPNKQSAARQAAVQALQLFDRYA
jgi:ribonuclease-3